MWRLGSIAGEASALSQWGPWQHAKEVARVEAAATSRLQRSEPLLGVFSAEWPLVHRSLP